MAHVTSVGLGGASGYLDQTTGRHLLIEDTITGGVRSA